MFVADWRGHGGAGGEGGADHVVRVAGDQQGAARAAANRRRAEPALFGSALATQKCASPTASCATMSSLPDLVNDRRAEGGLVERDRLRGRSTHSWGWMPLTATPGYRRFLARFRARCRQGRRIAQPEACLLGTAA